MALYSGRRRRRSTISAGAGNLGRIGGSTLRDVWLGGDQRRARDDDDALALGLRAVGGRLWASSLVMSTPMTAKSPESSSQISGQSSLSVLSPRILGSMPMRRTNSINPLPGTVTNVMSNLEKQPYRINPFT